MGGNTLHQPVTEKIRDKEQEGLKVVLQQFDDLFEDPKGLPSHTNHDHRILLKEGTSPLSVRPYRYPAVQKAEIEKMVLDMPNSGVIRHSTSPYSSPIIMVKKNMVLGESVLIIEELVGAL